MRAIKNIDLQYQLSRLRSASFVPEDEVALIYHRLGEELQSYEQVVEVRRIIMGADSYIYLLMILAPSLYIHFWRRTVDACAWIVPCLTDGAILCRATARPDTGISSSSLSVSVGMYQYKLQFTDFRPGFSDW